MPITTLSKFLTSSELETCWNLKQARLICEQVIKPNLARINQALGQENDPMYLAYAVEYAISQIAR